MKEKKALTASLIYLLRFFIKNAPFKVMAESFLSAIKNILIVVNSVLILDYLTNMILENCSFSDTLNVLVLMATINALANLFINWYEYCVKPRSNLKLKQLLDKRIMKHAETLSLCHYENSEFYTTVQQTQEAISNTMFSAYSEFLSAVITAISIDWRLLFFVAFSVPMIIVSKKYGRIFFAQKKSLSSWIKRKKYALQLWMTKESARTIKFTNASKIADKHYHEGFDGTVRTHNKYANQLFALDLIGKGFSITLIMIACYLYGIFASVYSNNFSVSGFSVMFVAVMNMVSRIKKLYKSYENFCDYEVPLNALNNFVHLKPESIHTDGLIPGNFESLEFRHVWFSYDKINWVLEDVSFRIESGEKVSILGYNGAGKSTLIKLLLRFYPVNRGEILYNGLNINHYQLSEYRKKFSTAFQDFQLFSFSLAENILMKECTEQELRAVQNTLLQMNKDELAANACRLFGRNYDKDGIVLSGGQEQWLAISRLYFSSFDIAILDEPSSALDPVSSKQMQDQLLRLMDKRTMIMVSHDMSVTNSMDQILFFDSGKLAANGKHEELMQQNQTYAEFYHCQAKNYQGGEK